jgi:probable rRNA maturation factor
MPSLELVNRQRKKRLDLAKLRAFAKPAIEKVSELVRAATLPEEIVVVFVSDARMARIHREFLALDGPTDVITFRHGEIIISVETAERQAKKFSTSFIRELRLYFVHGLLHLAGLDDLTEEGFKKMAAAQEQIVREIEESVSASVSEDPSGGSRKVSVSVPVSVKTPAGGIKESVSVSASVSKDPCRGNLGPVVQAGKPRRR